MDVWRLRSRAGAGIVAHSCFAVLRSATSSADLKDLYITSAKEVELPTANNQPKKTAIVIFVPFRLHKRFQKIQSRLVRELEKKFANKHVVFLAQRTIMSKTVRMGCVMLPITRARCACFCPTLRDCLKHGGCARVLAWNRVKSAASNQNIH